MSDLQASQRAPSAATISGPALGKLRSLGGATQVLGQSDGFADVFAEVFAHIAQSQATDRVEQPQPTEEVSNVGDDRADDSENVAPEQTDNDEGSVEVDAPSDLFAIDDGGGLQDDQSQHAADDHEVVQEVETEIVEQDADLEIAPVVVEQKLSETAKIERPAQIVQESAPEDQRDRRERNRGEFKGPEVAAGRADSKANTSASELSDGDAVKQVDPSALDDEGSLSDQGDSSEGEQPRRSRRSRRTQEGPNPNDAIQNARTKQDAGQRVASLENAAASDPATNPTANRSAPSNSPAVKQASASVAPVSQVATQAARIATPGGGGASANSGVRGVTPAGESMSQAAAADKDRPKADTSKSNTAETVSRVKLIQRVSKAFQHLGPEGGVVRLRLAPAEMGSVRVEMRIDQRRVQARVIAETEAATAALREHLPELRQRLEAQGMQIERIEVESEQAGGEHGRFHQGNGGRDSDGSNSSWQQWQRQGKSSSPPPVASSVSQRAPATDPLQASSRHGGVDLQL